MTLAHLALLGLAALLAFWVLGAYNRLMALRNAIGAAFPAVDEALQQRAAALSALLADMPEQLPGRHESLETLQATQQQVLAATDALRPRPALAARAAALVAAESALSAQLATLLQQLQHDPVPYDGTALASHRKELEEAALRLGFARKLFNDAVRAHNEAVRQFPTRLLVRLFGIGAAGEL